VHPVDRSLSDGDTIDGRDPADDEEPWVAWAIVGEDVVDASDDLR
jgi:hypothetical protein